MREREGGDGGSGVRTISNACTRMERYISSKLTWHTSNVSLADESRLEYFGASDLALLVLLGGDGGRTLGAFAIFLRKKSK